MSTVVDSIQARAFDVYERALGPAAKVSGSEHWWPVPWRDDSKASLRVNERGQWYDDPAGQGGDVITFWARKTGRDTKADFKALVAELAALLGIAVGNPAANAAENSQSRTTAALGDTDGMLARLEALAGCYGLAWADFASAQCRLTPTYYSSIGRKEQSVIYPLYGLDRQSRRKAKSLDRFQDGANGQAQVAQWPAGKRVSSHPGGGSGFFPASIRDRAAGKTDLVLCAGEEKTLALRKVGLHATSYSCGEGQITKRAADLLIWLGYTEYTVCLDAGPETAEGGPKWAQRLLDAGAKAVRIVTWPDGTPDKYDVNDLLREKGPAAVAKLVAGAVPWGTEVASASSTTPGAAGYIRPKLKPWKSTELAKAILPEMRFPIEGFLPEGLACLSAPPKAGKTMLAYAMGLALAAGHTFLGFPTARTGVLYLDAESNTTVIQSRLRSLGWPEGADGFEIWPTPSGWMLDAIGLAEVEDYVRANEVGLIVVDTMQRLVPVPPNVRNLDAYQAGVARFVPLQVWCNKMHCAMMMVHHNSKGMVGGEAFDAMSGSRGLTATAENLYTLTRKEGTTYRFQIDSRHMAPLDLLLHRDGVEWSVAGSSEDPTAERRQVIEWFVEHPNTSARDLAAGIGVDYDNAKKICSRMAKAGQLVRTKKGLYTPPCHQSHQSHQKSASDPVTVVTGGSSTHAQAHARARVPINRDAQNMGSPVTAPVTPEAEIPVTVTDWMTDFEARQDDEEISQW